MLQNGPLVLMQRVEGATGCLGLSKSLPAPKAQGPGAPRAVLGPWPPRRLGVTSRPDCFGLCCRHLGARLFPPGMPWDRPFLKSLLSRPGGHALVTFRLRLLLGSQQPRWVRRSSALTSSISEETRAEGQGLPPTKSAFCAGQDPVQGREPRGQPQICAGF